ncbi:hypothetical protein [Roseibium sp.]|uniref:hypothetical protein n=1 Tax=Roseibium sp. TaxID=1936156 RepID=UPI003A98645E
METFIGLNVFDLAQTVNFLVAGNLWSAQKPFRVPHSSKQGVADEITTETGSWQEARKTGAMLFHGSLRCNTEQSKFLVPVSVGEGILAWTRPNKRLARQSQNRKSPPIGADGRAVGQAGC